VLVQGRDQVQAAVRRLEQNLSQNPLLSRCL
jgi:hypothetical protein